MRVEYVKTESVVPYENNPRKNDDAVEAVANSIKEFGFKVPIVLDRENIIIAGHTRLKAAKRLGIESVPVVRADDLTEEQARAYRLADNMTGELAGWDYGKLDDELEEIRGINMADFGFNEIEDGFDTDAFFDNTKPVYDAVKTVQTVVCPCCGRLVEL